MYGAMPGTAVLRRSVLALLIVPIAGCMSVPSDLDQSRSRPTDGQRYQVAIRPLAEPIPLQQMHAWEVKLTSPAGVPVLQAAIKVDGGMPQHGHGLPTQPRVTRELGDGRYLVEGMKFSMPGWWELKLRVSTPHGGTDEVTFNQVIALPGAVRS